jgi:hypothetical protein
LEKFSNADFKALTDLVDDPQLDGIVGAVNDVIESSLGDTAFYKELILRHSAFLQQLCNPHTDGLIEMQHLSPHFPFCAFIIC